MLHLNPTKSDFYNSSVLLDIFEYPIDNTSLEIIVGKIVREVYPLTGFKKSGEDYSIYFYHLEQITLNLIVYMITGRPIAYSRDRNNYSSSSRYQKIHFRYSYLIKLIDKLHDLGYIHHAIGIFYTNNKKVSRFWATEKFINLIKEVKLAMPVKVLNAEPIRLHAKKHHKNDKKLKSYDDNDHPAIPQMREDINHINQTLKQADIRLKINNDVISGNFLKKINDNSLFDNVLSINSCDITHKVIRFITTNLIDKFNDHSILRGYNYSNYNLNIDENSDYVQHGYNIIPLHNNNQCQQSLSYDLNSMIGKLLNVSIGKNCNEYYFVDNLELIFRNKTFNRVFNEDFDHGGRFFSALIQQIPKYMRDRLTINGNKTVELDYSAQHLRMLYQQIGIDYRDDPYGALIDKSDVTSNYIDDIIKITPNADEIKLTTAKTGLYPNIEVFTKFRRFKNMSERAKYKVAQLILINATEKPDKKPDKKGKKMSAEEVAIRAVMNKLIDSGVANVKQKVVEDIINRFKKVHEPIVDFLFSGIASELQNLDSKIMNEILVTLARKGIPALSYHDSIRVEEQHEDVLRGLMMEVYKKHVGFYPVI